jgi:hypothetical protein
MAASNSSYPGPASTNTTAITPPPLSASSQGRGGGISPHSATYPPQIQGQVGFYPQQPSPQPGGVNGGTGGPQNQNPALDYEQAGIDFVLT